jgi:flagellin
MRINNNMAAANASRNLGETQANISKNVEKLSTGYRINRAGDDASGLVISNSLRAQTSGLRQAIRNGQDGVSVLQTAEGALDQVNTMLNRMRDLAVQAANTGTNSLAARTAAQAEVTALGEEVNRISSTTKFGSLSLLDGSFGVTTAKSSGFVSNASSIVVAAANTQLAITFNTGSATTGIVTGTVTASLTAGTYTSAEAYASEVSRAVKAALLAAGTAAVQGLADSVNVTSASVTGGGAALTLDIGGLATGQTFTTAGGATAAGASTGWTAMTTAEVTGSGGNFQVGANAGDVINLSLGSTNMASLGLSTISLTGTDAAISATIAALDSAVNTISTQRGSIGALQNRFESMIQNLQVTTENLAASESRIRDTDMAAEMVEFTKNQVLSQAGTAMLAQANQIPQGILSLLRG